MKSTLKNYTFNVAAKTVTLTDVATVRLDRLYLIVDATTDTILYNFADATVSLATVATNVITLAALPGGVANADKLVIIYDADTGDTAFNDTVTSVKLTGGSAIVGKVTTDQTTHGTTDKVAADITQVAGSAIPTGHGTASGSVRVELPTDGTGKVGIDQSTPGITNGVSADIEEIAGAPVSLGHGTAGAGAVLRVELPTDGTGVVGLNGTSVIRNNHAADAALTISLAALANSVAGVGRQSTLIDNTTNKYASALVYLSIKVGTTPVANTPIYIYLIRSNNNQPIADDGAGTTDAGITINNAPLLGVINCSAATTGAVYSAALDTSLLGPLGPRWGIAVVNSTNVALDATEGNHAKSYIGITKQV